ncbi:hypothetical protein [Vitiosangium sp. GDMCC 1.1324]|uniref:hypothetical protein n=1 Tax=Vitiosangium sp. (strain GDMCC 1.1324) TaxID=2138576 RepID=UPI000D3A620B|nr:hypothetical protein [Vitiosangium sp. GDMCC 1.1324]PTL82491.1 hypothetical protein DAT35_16905 [Vitiosangium sp. GDMCC 1.1324]
MAELRERPILFSGNMVRAILDGRKTQTWRMLKPQPAPNQPNDGGTLWAWLPERGVHVPVGSVGHLSVAEKMGLSCPYGRPGDRLWVRETWGVMSSECSTALVSYAARLPEGKTLAGTDGGCNVITVPDEWRERLEGLVDTERWRPSIHMCLPSLALPQFV